MGGEARAKTRRAFLSYIFFLTTVFVLEILFLLILRVGACVWPWLPERVVVVHIPCVLSTFHHTLHFFSCEGRGLDGSLESTRSDCDGSSPHSTELRSVHPGMTTSVGIRLGSSHGTGGTS